MKFLCAGVLLTLFSFFFISCAEQHKINPLQLIDLLHTHSLEKSIKAEITIGSGLFPSAALYVPLLEEYWYTQSLPTPLIFNHQQLAIRGSKLFLFNKKTKRFNTVTSIQGQEGTLLRSTINDRGFFMIDDGQSEKIFRIREGDENRTSPLAPVYICNRLTEKLIAFDRFGTSVLIKNILHPHGFTVVTLPLDSTQKVQKVEIEYAHGFGPEYSILTLKPEEDGKWKIELVKNERTQHQIILPEHPSGITSDRHNHLFFYLQTKNDTPTTYVRNIKTNTSGNIDGTIKPHDYTQIEVQKTTFKPAEEVAFFFSEHNEPLHGLLLTIAAYALTRKKKFSTKDVLKAQHIFGYFHNAQIIPDRYKLLWWTTHKDEQDAKTNPFKELHARVTQKIIKKYGNRKSSHEKLLKLALMLHDKNVFSNAEQRAQLEQKLVIHTNKGSPTYNVSDGRLMVSRYTRLKDEKVSVAFLASGTK